MEELEAIRERKLRELMERASQAAQVEGSAAPSEPVTLTDGTFRETLREHELVLVDFWAPWCGPCRRVAPVIRQLARDYQGDVVFGKLNTDENPRTSAHYRVRSIPTLMLFRKGNPVEVLVGAHPRASIERLLQKHAA